MNTVAVDLLGGIVYASDAHLVWEDLRERFDKVNQVRIFQLHKEIATLTQGTNSVSVYFSKLMEFWHEFDVLVPLPGCDCVKSKDYKDHLQQQRIMQYLSGLNDSYDQARRQILMKSAAPTLNQAYAMIVQDESQQSMVATTIVDKPEPMAMQVGRGQGFRGRKQLLYCDHCRMKDHTKEICYKIIGYPSDFKGKKRYSGPGSDNWKKESPVIANNVELGTVSQNSGDGAGPSEVRGNYFTDEQYRQILSMLKDPGEHHANMTGPLQWQGERDW